jgi:hypothetical protein
MALLTRLLLTLVLSIFVAGAASAVPVTFQLDNVTTVGGAFVTAQTYIPGFPITGSGNIDFGAGTGTLSLSNYSIILDVSADLVLDARIDISGWTQTITAIDGLGNITSTGGGSAVCTVLGGIGGFVCPGVAPTIPGWPPANGTTLLSSAVLNQLAQTITVIDNSNANAGTVTQYFSYSIVPEPGTGLLVASGVFAFGLYSRRRRA